MLLPNAGHVRFEVAPTHLQFAYVRAYLPGEGPNQEVADSGFLGGTVAATPLPVENGRLLITPNPAAAAVQIRPVGAAVPNPDQEQEVCIYDLGGRLVRRLAPDADGAFRWNRADTRGRPAPSGTYFATWRGGATPVTGRLTIVR